MRTKLLLAFSGLLLIALQACNRDCVPKADPNCFCTLQYDPVCGCDGNTYGNACEAACYGIEKYTKGTCK